VKKKTRNGLLVLTLNTQKDIAKPVKEESERGRAKGRRGEKGATTVMRAGVPRCFLIKGDLRRRRTSGGGKTGGA